MFRQDFSYPLVKVGVEARVVREAMVADVGLDPGIRVPLDSVVLVAADVEEGVGEKGGHLPQEIAQKRVGRLVRRV